MELLVILFLNKLYAHINIFKSRIVTIFASINIHGLAKISTPEN